MPRENLLLVQQGYVQGLEKAISLGLVLVTSEDGLVAARQRVADERGISSRV